MKRRLVLLLLFAVAIAMAGAGWQSYTASTPEPLAPMENTFPVLSPRRIPGITMALPQEAQLRSGVAAALAAPTQTPGALACIAVRRQGRIVVNTGRTASLVPASTVKVLTAAAALHAFDPDDRFRTTVASDDQVDDGTVVGPLYLIGGGDPLLLTADFVQATNGHRSVHTSLETLADQVVKAGVRTVQGGVGGDDTRFDGQRYAPGWEAAYRTEGQVGPIGALLINQGFTGAGKPPVGDPTGAAAATFQKLLEDRGVAFTEPARSVKAPSNHHEIASIDSATVPDLVSEMLTESDNTTAEMLVKSLEVKAGGDPGSFAGGVQAVTKELQQLGIPLEGVLLMDGSGLDRANRVTCSALVAILSREGDAGSLARGLPRAGETGTLTTRFTGSPAIGRLSAKTGTLAGVSGLAGWARPDGQTPFSFAVIANGLTTGASRALEDQLAVLLSTVPAPSPVVAYAPGGVKP